MMMMTTILWVVSEIEEQLLDNMVSLFSKLASVIEGFNSISQFELPPIITNTDKI